MSGGSVSAAPVVACGFVTRMAIGFRIAVKKVRGSREPISSFATFAEFVSMSVLMTPDQLKLKKCS